jgi:hypothetical protein
MTNAPNDQPLWRLMFEAGAAVTAKGAHSTTHEAKAAELRAIADRVVPEEAAPGMSDFPDANDAAPWQRWQARQRIRARLLAEADRAEAGE